MAQPITLPALPYSDDALAPVISTQTIGFHYGKHHQAYVNNLNNLIQGKPYAEMSLEQIIKDSFGKDPGVFNNSAQVWNHTFYWNSLTPKSSGKPSGALASKIDSAFGSLENFKKEFATAATTQFGSGWAWLVADAQKNLKIVKTSNAETPLTTQDKPLLTLDVWEHAYYLDYQNKRPDYVNALIDKLINWEFAEKNFGA